MLSACRWFSVLVIALIGAFSTEACAVDDRWERLQRGEQVPLKELYAGADAPKGSPWGLYEEGNVQEARRIFYGWLDFYSENGTPSQHINALDGVAWFELQQGNLPVAIEYFQSAYAIAVQLKDWPATRRVAANLASAYSSNGDFAEARVLFDRIITECGPAPSGESFSQAGYATQELGRIYLHQNEMDKADEYLKRALAMAQKKRNAGGLCQTGILVAEVMRRDGQLLEALTQIRNARENCKEASWSHNNWEAVLLGEALILGELAFLDSSYVKQAAQTGVDFFDRATLTGNFYFSAFAEFFAPS